jgi:serine/threonine protein kinase
MSFLEKLEVYKELRQKLKKKKIFLDESKDSFGFKMKTLVDIKDVRNTEDIKGYPLLLKVPLPGALSSNVPLSPLRSTSKKIVLKVVPIETKYNKREHPVYLESLVLRYLTDDLLYNCITPNITNYLYDFKASNNSKALHFLNLKIYEKKDLVKRDSTILVSEYVSGGNLGEWVYNKYNESDEEISDNVWKSIVFQLIYTIFVLQHKYKMMHNDFHYGNILIDDTFDKDEIFRFTIIEDGIEQNWYVPHQGIVPKLWDFEFAMVYNNRMKDFYPNQFVVGGESGDGEPHNVPDTYNEVYDLHYFLTSLLDLYISKELFKWIMQLYPDVLIPPETSTDSTDTSVDSTDTSVDSTDTSVDSTDTSVVSTDSRISLESRITSSGKSEYIRNGRIINGMEANFKLPIPYELLKNEMFDLFKTPPENLEKLTVTQFKVTL